MPSRRRLMYWILALVACYVVIVALFWAMQDRMIYVGAEWGRGQPLPAVEGVSVERLPLPAGGEFRIALAKPSGEVPGVVVTFAGNGEDLRSGVRWAAFWTHYGHAAVAVEYPGYGESDGVPGKATFFAAAEAAVQRAREFAPGVPVTAVGNSLGAFTATHLAAAGLVDRLLLFAPPLSIARAGSERFPWLPVGLLLRHDFDNAALAARVECPVLIVHGDADQVVPVHHGRELRERFAGPARFVVAEGHGHNDLPIDATGPMAATIREFLTRSR